jgi:short-subunit dehydrogenase
MRNQGDGKILITGAIAGFVPGASVYNGTKAFLDSFSYALREELRETRVTVTCLMPGATETDFFRRADTLDHMATSRTRGSAFGLKRECLTS